MDMLCSPHRAGATALLLARLAMSACASAEEPTRPAADGERIAALVGQLGNEEFTLREAASDELTRLGLPAFSALEAAAQHPDREVRFRSIRILAQIRDRDLARRLEAFLAGKDDRGEYPLPGWSRFAKAYGDNSQSRQLFVEMQRADPEVLRSLEETPRAAADLVSQRTAQHQQQLQLGNNRQLPLGEVAVLVFVAGEEDVSLPDNTLSMVLSYCFQPAMRDAVNHPSRRDVPRKMLGAAIRKCSDSAAPQAMQVAMEFGMEEGLVPAVKILKAQGGRIPYMNQYALMAVAKLGDASHLPLVEPLMDDSTVVTRRQENKRIVELQVRDAALATAILLTKQDLKTYFTGRQELASVDPRNVYFNPQLIGFEKDEDRAAVFKKWAEYKAQQPQTQQPQAAPPAEAK
jgi:hypothetical protein